MTETITVRGENITLDLLLWRRFGVRGRSLVEKTLDRNQNLAAKGTYLPLGTVVELPDLIDTSTTSRRVVSLFG